MELEEYIIELILAISTDDIENTKKYTKLINECSSAENSMTFITESLHLSEYNNNLDNKSVDYVLENLIYLNGADAIRLKRKKEKLLQEHDNTQTKNFILQQLEEPTYKVLKQELLQTLLQLTTSLRDKVLINDFLQKIKEKFFI